MALTQTKLDFEANQDLQTSLAPHLESTKAIGESEKKASGTLKEDQLNELSVLSEAMNHLKEAHEVASPQAVLAPVPFLQITDDTGPESGVGGGYPNASTFHVMLIYLVATSLNTLRSSRGCSLHLRLSAKLVQGRLQQVP